jgi:hypothetical protein
MLNKKIELEEGKVSLLKNKKKNNKTKKKSGTQASDN